MAHLFSNLSDIKCGYCRFLSTERRALFHSNSRYFWACDEHSELLYQDEEAQKTGSKCTGKYDHGGEWTEAMVRNNNRVEMFSKEMGEG